MNKQLLWIINQIQEENTTLPAPDKRLCFDFFIYFGFFGPVSACHKMAQLNFAAVSDLSPVFLFSERVGQILPGQLGPHRSAGESPWRQTPRPLSFQRLIICWCFCRATSRASRTFCSPGRRLKASWSTTLSSRRSRSRWWMWEVRGRRGRSGFSASTASRPYFSWSHPQSTIR